MRIGISSGISNSPNSATFAEVVAGLGYNYTWAADFGGLDASDFTLPTGADAFDTVNYNADGIRVASNESTNLTNQGVIIQDSVINGAAHSYNAGDFPVGALPDVHNPPDGGSPVGFADSPENAIGHPGRYITIVTTFHKMDMSGSVNYPAMQLTINGVNILWNKNANPAVPYAFSTILNGETSTLFDQASYDAIIGSTTLVTYDMNDSKILALGDLGTDPNKFEIRPSYAKASDYDVTYHGIILSDAPPSVALGFTLPVEIINPSIT